MLVNKELRVLSISSDRIAVPAFRAAGLLATISPPIDRTGAGRICEVYPAGALQRWGFHPRGYKGTRNRPARLKLVDGLLRRTETWLKVGEYRDLCVDNDNALDALVACLVARAKACGFVEEIPVESRARASREGWIALPTAGSLDNLPNAATV